MVDFVTYGLLTASFFFVALSFALLLRYRQVSERINYSTDLGRDLWSSLEQRLKKQDERILDVMGRMEVIQAKMITAAANQPSPSLSQPQAVVPPPQTAAPKEKPNRVTEPASPMQQLESQEERPESQQSQAQAASQTPIESSLVLDETQLSALKLLGDSPKDTRQLTDALQKSREHTARLMKELFGMGLVRRNDSSKPFVYQLTDEGRRHLPSSSQ